MKKATDAGIRKRKRKKLIIVEKRKRKRTLASFPRPVNMPGEWGGHQHRVSELAGDFAAWLRNKKLYSDEIKSNQDIEVIRIGGSMHDTGKNLNRVRSKINHQKRLTKKQLMQVDRDHTLKGFRSLAVTIPANFQPEAREKILQMTKYHHEHFDGTGPHKLRGEDIPFVGRLGAICDAFDGITDPERRYKKPLSAMQALGEIEKDSGKKYDPGLTGLFDVFIREKLR